MGEWIGGRSIECRRSEASSAGDPKHQVCWAQYEQTEQARTFSAGVMAFFSASLATFFAAFSSSVSGAFLAPNTRDRRLGASLAASSFAAFFAALSKGH